MFSTEEQLQLWLADRLRAAGHRPQLEVVTHARHKTRADIVVSDTVIECKKILDRESIHNAYSQAIMYSRMLNKPKRVLVGMPPFNLDAQRSARSAAAAIMSTDADLSIYWINQSGVFPIEQHRGSVLDKVSVPVRQPAPTPVVVPAPAATTSSPFHPTRNDRRKIPTWKLIGMLVYVALGAWFGGGLGALFGGLGGVLLIRSK